MLPMAIGSESFQTMEMEMFPITSGSLCCSADLSCQPGRRGQHVLPAPTHSPDEHTVLQRSYWGKPGRM